MFAKLLKYEWKSASPVLAILSLCALAAGLLGGGVMRFLIYCTEQLNTGNDAFGVLMLLAMLVLMGLFLAIMAYVAGSQIMLFYRFYKSRFTDEGYLTFTLPVSAGQVFWSSYLVILGWMLICVVVMLLSFGAILLLGTLGKLSWAEFQDSFSIYAEIYDSLPGGTVITGIVTVVSFLANIVYYMTAITVGSIIAKKHKLLAAIGVYIGASFLMSMITGTLSLFAAIFAYTASANTITFVYVMEIIFSLAMATGGCALNIYLMKNKLNLP